jgi:hypothetical protein
MKMNKIIVRFFVVLIVLLTLTAGYAQAYPGFFSIGSSKSAPSLNDIISSWGTSLIYSKYSADAPQLDIFRHSTHITRDRAIEIAESLWPWAVWKTMSTRQLGNTWSIKLSGCINCNCESGHYCPGTPVGGTVTIDATSGEIISVNAY